MFETLKKLSTTCICSCAALGVIGIVGCPTPVTPDPFSCPDDGSAVVQPQDCVGRSLEYLRRTMDRYHGEQFWVYEDADSAGNHFFVWSSFTREGIEENCPVIIHGDTRNTVPSGSASCLNDTERSGHVEWRRYTAPAGGTATISLDASFDSVLSIHRGCPGPDQEELACTLGSGLTMAVERSESYLIRIAGVGEAAGPYELVIDGPAPPDAKPVLNCNVSAEFNSFVTQISDGEPPSPISEGATAIGFRLNYTDQEDFGGLVMNNGVFDAIRNDGTMRPNYGHDEGAGVDLSGARALKFHARGEKGGETVTFFVGGVGWDGNRRVTSYPDSTNAIEIVRTLTTDWTEYTIPVVGADLSHVIGGFGWAANAKGDPDFVHPESDNALMFYVDNIFFELDEAKACERRLLTPRFLQSFTTRPLQTICDPIVGDFDHRFRTVAFVYDNALALLAFLAEGTPNGLARAQLIGEAFVHAATRDRSFQDGRLRSAYSAGELTLPPGWTPNYLEDEVRLAGFWNPQCQEFHQLFHDNLSVGNTAWAMVALLALYERTQDDRFLDAARDLGELISLFRNDECEDDASQQVGGFTGGIKNTEASVDELEPFSSAEHNIDVYAAFKKMYEITREERWLDDAEHAKRFVRELWGGDELGCLYAGHSQDCEIDMVCGHLPLDIQAWAVLGIPDLFTESPEILDCTLSHHLSHSDGFEGFDFNEDGDGVWFEGTAHMATAFAFVGQTCLAERFKNELCRAQRELPLRDNLPPSLRDEIGLVAGSHDGISTGFGFLILNRLHIGATAWNVFAQRGWNPYSQVTSENLEETQASDDCVIDPGDAVYGGLCEVPDEESNADAPEPSEPRCAP